MYVSYINELQAKKRNTSNDYERSIYSKLAIQCNRWALSLWIVGAALTDQEYPKEIDNKTMSYAIDCMRYFEGTALKVKEIISSRQPSNIEKEPTKADTIRGLLKYFPDTNKSALARALDVSQPYIAKVSNSQK